MLDQFIHTNTATLSICILTVQVNNFPVKDKTALISSATLRKYLFHPDGISVFNLAARKPTQPGCQACYLYVLFIVDLAI